MGCDIHFYVEKKTPEGWELIKPTDPTDEFGLKYCHFYHGRNYRLFGVLANVRNGWGFAGVDTGDAIEPISEPRGLPDDVSKFVKNKYDEWGYDAHSASWLLLKELKNYDWKKTITLRGYVHEDQYQKMKTGALPESWCGETSGPNIATMTASQYEELTAEQKLDSDFLMENFRSNHYYPHTPNKPIDIRILAQWSWPLFEVCREFPEQTIPKLEALGSDDEIRAVFWFDN